MNMSPSTLTMGTRTEEGNKLAIDFSVLDAAAKPWTLSDQLDAAAVITFHRGDF